MGEEDIRRQALNVFRMQLLGAEVVPSDRQPHAQGRHQRGDARLGHQRRHHALHPRLVAGPHPFPPWSATSRRIIGDEARQQVLELTGRLPDAVVACVGGGSNAIGIFTAFVDDPSVGWSASRPAAGVAAGQHAATLVAGAPGVLHGARSYLLQDDDGPDARDPLDLRRPRLPGRRARARLAARRAGRRTPR